MLTKQKCIITPEERTAYEGAFQETGKYGCMILIIFLIVVVLSIGLFFRSLAPQVVYIMGAILLLVLVPIMLWALWYKNKWKNHGLEYRGVLTGKWHRYGQRDVEFVGYLEFEQETLQVGQEIYDSMQQYGTEVVIRSWPQWGVMKNMQPKSYTYLFHRQESRVMTSTEQEEIRKYIAYGKYLRANLDRTLFDVDLDDKTLQVDLFQNKVDGYEAYIVDKQIRYIAETGVVQNPVEQYWIHTSMGRLHVHRDVFRQLPCASKVILYALPLSSMLFPYMLIEGVRYDAVPVPNGNTYGQGTFADKNNYD